MWKFNKPSPVKLIFGVLAADSEVLAVAVEAICGKFGRADAISDTWPFNMTDYYKSQTGDNILRQFVSIEKLTCPGRLASIKHRANRLEMKLSRRLKLPLPRPANIDPGIIEPSKLILATTKNYSHRIYIGRKIWAEVTLVFDRGRWKPFEYTYPDYRQKCYHNFFTVVRNRLLRQLKQQQDL